MKITVSHLYSFFQCPHRLWRDLHDNLAPKERRAQATLEALQDPRL